MAQLAGSLKTVLPSVWAEGLVMYAMLGNVCFELLENFPAFEETHAEDFVAKLKQAAEVSIHSRPWGGCYGEREILDLSGVSTHSRPWGG